MSRLEYLVLGWIVLDVSSIRLTVSKPESAFQTVGVWVGYFGSLCLGLYLIWKGVNG